MTEQLTELKKQIVERFLEFLGADDAEGVHEFLDTGEEDLILYHHTVGRNIRNEFQLWHNELLKANEICPDGFSFECVKEIHARGNERRKQAFRGK